MAATTAYQNQGAMGFLARGQEFANRDLADDNNAREYSLWKPSSRRNAAPMDRTPVLPSTIGTTAEPKYKRVLSPPSTINQDRVRPIRSHSRISFSLRFSTCQAANF